MAHYAKIRNGIVIKVIVAQEDFFNSFVDNEPGQWIKTSYNTRGGIHYQPDSDTPSEDQSKALRKNYAGIGYSYDINRDAFIPPKPFNSWILDEVTCYWDPPLPYPEEGTYEWNEDEYNNSGNGWITPSPAE
jgi:hypothetical protein